MSTYLYRYASFMLRSERVTWIDCCREWENEVARNILAIYRADASRYHQADSTVERESPLLTEAPRRAPTKKVSPLPSPSKTKKGACYMHDHDQRQAEAPFPGFLCLFTAF